MTLGSALVVLGLVLMLPASATPILAGEHSTSTSLPLVAPSGSMSSLAASWEPSLSAPWAARVGYDPGLYSGVEHPTAANGQVTVTLTLRPTSDALFAPLPAGSRPLTAQQVANRFGEPSAEYEALQQYFEGFGLHVVGTWEDRLALTVAGPAQAVGAAFGTTVLSGSWSGRGVQLTSGVPELPAPYSGEIAAISGLSQGFSTYTLPLSQSVPTVSKSAQPAQGRTTTQLMPADARNVYGISDLYNFTGSPTYASGVGVALLLWGWGYNPSDVSTFFANYFGAGYPTPQVVPYPVDGAPQPSANATNDPSGAPMELTLDIEWAGTMAPGATLDAVYAPDGPDPSDGYSPTDSGLEMALNTAVQIPGVRVISMSFGGDDGNDTSFQAAFSTSFAAATQEGITLVAASGDNGGSSSPGCNGAAAPQFPAASPQVLAVGGTAPVLAQTALGQVTGIESQPAWNQSGGGYSVSYAAPSWQLVGSAEGPISAHGHRGIPDVAGPAADNFLYYSGRSEWAAGTSFAAPLWAGMIAEMDALKGSPLGFITPHLYSLAAAGSGAAGTTGFTDITSGANCVAQATTGWDPVTGWGAPNAKLLYAEISYTSVEVSFSSVPTSSTPGGSVAATITVLNSTSGQPMADLPVSVVLAASDYAGPCGGTLSTSMPTTDANGQVQVQLGIPSCFLGSHAVVTATVLSNGYYGQSSSGITVNLLGFAGFLAFIQYFPYNVLAFTVVISLAVVVGWRLGRRRKRPPAATPAVGYSAPAGAYEPAQAGYPPPPG